MFEPKARVILLAGPGSFALSFLVMGLFPWAKYHDRLETSVTELAEEGMTHEFLEWAERFPERFNKHFPDGATTTSFAEALQLGRDVYVAEACWHCHTQQVRPVSSDRRRWGPASRTHEYHNALQRPVLFGTRRIGPDLIREAARRTNDWHLAHFYKPTSVVRSSVMPEYKWFFDEDGYPNKKGMAIITYMQWLGSRLPEYPYFRGVGAIGAAKDGDTPPAADDATNLGQTPSA